MPQWGLVDEFSPTPFTSRGLGFRWAWPFLCWVRRPGIFHLNGTVEVFPFNLNSRAFFSAFCFWPCVMPAKSWALDRWCSAGSFLHKWVLALADFAICSPSCHSAGCLLYIIGHWEPRPPCQPPLHSSTMPRLLQAPAPAVVLEISPLPLLENGGKPCSMPGTLCRPIVTGCLTSWAVSSMLIP
jgi:hypothetical protein